jgi:hypothetical protein
MQSTATILIISALIIIGCGNQHANKNIIEPKSAIENGYKEIDLQIIIGKNYIDGCGCYFSLDSSNFSKGDYHLLFDYNSKCVININGKDIELHSNDSISTIYPDEDKKFFQNEKFEITIDLFEDQKSGDETYLYKGFMTLLIKESGERYKKEIIGECGC